ncbi:two-component regulator propeller domain-containing protein [Echinicola jeungdonensis]|uniref:histidine kinase n=1 Tax=Echinicola jeungdonensis TaxID=709343 RepID=A0ABV5J4Y4_9BACT|nr:hybrid sensor histidine kinase/response regulator transcription factor [Echinicola jeungdonensis]MDN3669515.1 two-component regulator propeller domain-containing protein [Echinicola jeungdonensis]
MNLNISHLILLCLLFLIGIGKVDAQDKHLKFNHFSVQDGLPQNSIYAIAKDKYGFMWFGTWGGAVRYDGYNIRVFRAHEKDSTTLSDNRINAIVTDSLQNIWVAVEPNDFVFKYDYESETFKYYPSGQVPAPVVKKIKERYGYWRKKTANKNYTWLTTYDNGLLQINRNTGDTITYHADPSDPNSLSDDLVKDLFLDNTGHLWVGTQSRGISHADLNIKPFFNYYKDQPGKGLIDNVVRAVCMDQEGRLWVGSENQGITIIEQSKNGPLYTYIRRDKLIDPQIRNLYCDRQGIIWIGTKRGLTYYDPSDDTFTNCSLQNMCHPNVFDVIEDQQGNIWVATFDGLARYDKEKDQFHCLNTEFELAGKQIMDIHVGQENQLWIATEDGGLSRLVPTPDIEKEYKVINYTHQKNTKKSIPNNRTYSLTEDNQGNIWIATTAGLSKFNPENNTFQNFTNETGLTNELTMAVVYDGDQSIWVSHTKGLTKVDIHNGEMQNFNLKDGLQGNDFTQNAVYYHPEDGKLFFGGSNGLTSFDPDKIKINPYPPKVALTNLNVMHRDLEPGDQVNDHVILDQSLLTSKKITLTWWDKTFRLEFAALHYANPLSNKYKYKLEGYDEDWIYTDASRRLASYSNLPSGNYTFKVYGANSDGVWSENPATLQVEVLPPWWLSWWAYILYILAACILALFVYRYLNSKIQLRKKEAIHQAKLHFFTQISHEFRTPLTLIIDPLERLMAEKPKGKIAEHYYQLMHRNAKQLLMLINQLLDFRKLESGHLKLNLQKSDIVAFSRGLASSFEEMAKKRQIRFKVETHLDQFFMPFDDAKLTMVLNNLLSNAFKFTPDHGQISLTLEPAKKTKSGILIKVEDSGHGISKEEQEKVFGIFYQASTNKEQNKGSGIGLSLSKELVNLHGGEIKMESSLGEGTCFSIFLPVLENKEPSQAIPEFPTEPDRAETLSHEPGPKKTNNKNVPLILVVDDNADIRAYIEINFNSDYRVILATNGNEGLEKAIDRIPDLVISDIMMPDLNGLQLCSKLKSDERTSHIPVILLTARQSDDSKMEGYETGADAYVTKPFNTTVLRAQVNNLLEQRRQLRELFSKGSAMEFKKIAVNAADEAFLEKARKLIESNLDSETFDIDSLAMQLNMSRSQFYRKIKALTNKSASDFVTTFRMNKATEFLLSGQFNVTETAYKVGYSLPNNFTRAFIKHFGTSPSQYTGKEEK